jgi:serine/threonine protein kinase
MKYYACICAACGTANPMASVLCWACGKQLFVSSTTVSVSSAPPLLPSPLEGLLKQRYRVLSIVGKGGMGTVSIGKDLHMGNRLVAIKEMTLNSLSPQASIKAVYNFQREALLLATLQHPNLPSIYDHFEERKHWYFVMSFIQGQTLTEYLRTQKGRLKEEEVIEIGIVLCGVLTYLHTHEPPIIFRDLKPANIMRTEDGHLYLIDFGIARFFKEGQMKDTTVYGSSGYTPPEQYGRAQTTPRSDIYSLGATLYYLLSGYDPANNPFRLPPIQSLVPATSSSLASLIGQMLDFDERKRPQSAEAVKWNLQTISKKGHSSLRFVDRGKRKRGKMVSLIVVGILLLLVALALIAENLTRVNRDTPSAVVNAFCNAMNTSSPDFQTAYVQFSHQYQHEHSLQQFQQAFQRTLQCTVASQPNEQNQAGISLMMACPFGPPPDKPPLNGTPSNGAPPGGGPPPGAPPPVKNPVNLMLIHDGGNGWKIDTISIVGSICGAPH